MQQLYENAQPPQTELKRLNHSVITKFLELLDFLVNDPFQYMSKIADIELLFLNMHNLLNSYRSHQARQVLISWLEEQKLRRQQTIDRIQE